MNVRCYLESYHEPQYVAHYHHLCINESTVLLSVILVAWAFKGNESNTHLNPAYWWLHTRVYCPLRQDTRFITLSISRGHFILEMIFEINHKEHSTPVRNRVSFGGLNYFFYHIFARVVSNTAVVGQQNIESIVVHPCHRCYIFMECGNWCHYFLIAGNR